MVYIVLLCLLLVLLIVTALVVALNLGTLLSTGVHLTVFSVHLPGIPVLLLAVSGAFLGGLALYVVALRAARRDAAEIKSLRGRIEDLEKAPTKSPSGGLSAGFAPSVVPMPGFGSGGSQAQGPAGPPNASGPFGSGGLLSNASPSSSQGGSFGSSGLPGQAPAGSANGPFGAPGLAGQTPAGSQGLSGSANSPFGAPG